MGYYARDFRHCRGPCGKCIDSPRQPGIITGVCRKPVAYAGRKSGAEGDGMKVYFTGAGPGDPDLLTVKARRLLEGARCCIWAGSLVNPQIIELLPAGCRVYDSAGMNLEQIIEVMRECATEDIDVVRLHTGEPALYGAIGEQMRELDRLGIAYEQIPGISAFQAAAATLRLELTAPEVAQAVVITRAPGRTPLPEAQNLAAFARTGATLCVYLSAHKVDDICAELAQHYGADCPAAFVYKASWPQEQSLRGTLTTLPGLVTESGLSKTALILVGRALTGGEKSRLYDPAFAHEFREVGGAISARKAIP